MGLFEKREKVFEMKGSKSTFKAVKARLKEEGIRGVRSNVWTDEIQGCGCGAKLDNRDFGPNGKIDRDIYTIRVLEEDAEKASSIVKEMVPEYSPYEPRPDKLRLV